MEIAIILVFSYYFRTYSVETGGSILIIGSDAGVVDMGMGKISFSGI